MRWQNRKESSNVEDRRGMTGKKLAVGGGLGGIVVMILYLLLGGNLGDNAPDLQLSTDAAGPAESRPLTPAEQEAGKFVSVILADTEDVWNALFQAQGRTYVEPKLVLFTDLTDSGCGTAQAASGPFYCPGDEKVYIDLGFFAEMQQRLNAPGDFAQAYVIAHEIGHHVQNQLGIMDKVTSLRDRVSEQEYNALSVRLELQADFLAGVWANHAQRMQNILEEGDIQEGINAAGAVGDDRIQRMTQGYVVPDAFTHGTSEQRVRWFLKGFKTGDLAQGDTFNASSL
ncbi:MAG: metalloprotease [Candidatus Aminicenantes bacterium RBG_16_63_16]|nr:MAG: metalloprotease [Candidatus Aminicenantes bacterium RBG_16_63_16]